METKITFRRAMNAATALGKFFGQQNMVTVGPTTGTPSLAEQVKLLTEKMLHSAYPNAIAGKPEESVDEKNRLNLAQAWRNFLGLFVSKKNSVYDSKANETSKTQRKAAYGPGLERFYKAEVTGIENFEFHSAHGDLAFYLITDQGKIKFDMWRSMLEPVERGLKDNAKKFISEFGDNFNVSPDQSFNLKTFNLKSAKKHTVDISIKAFSYLKEHIEKYRSDIGSSFEVFKTNVELILAGLQNLKSQAKS